MASAHARVRARLGAAVGADGAVRRPCASRTLESALLLVLLRQRGSHTQEAGSLVAYLATPQAQATGFDAAMSRAVLLGENTATDVVGGELLADFDHFSVARKRLFFDVCLAVAGAVPFESTMLPPVRATAPGEDNTVVWIEMIRLSLRVLAAHGLDREGELTDRERHRLVDLLDLSRAPVWENYPAAHLLTLLAVQQFAPGHPLVARGTSRVVACRNQDGGVPSLSNLDVISTGAAGIALARANAEGALLNRIGDYLVSRQRPDGGWPFGEDMSHSDVDSSSYVAGCLATIDAVRHRAALLRAGEYFRGLAGPDGGFPTYVHGDPSETGMTGGAVSGLAWNPQAHGDLLEGAARWLLDAQHEDGTFERSWSLSEANAIWRATWALNSIPEPVRTVLRPRLARADAAVSSFLNRAQNSDGGWGYRPGHASDTASTCYSLLSLAAIGRRLDTDPVVRAGIEHLIARQEPDGGFTALPDQVAPRPLLFDPPVWADIWALMAMASCNTDWNWPLPAPTR
ncbi:prenyltransferase/squalene oxidase repeat-containing protein [Streptomyces omiyaensis]|uniref:prenyltransferase/squalene oxidase repeat-containing protein n=1 Tax=Streptomyces omiyaensis TaxID=68247 RepID=UPI0036F81657